jgi:CDP-glucose 4,6-dehydratase
MTAVDKEQQRRTVTDGFWAGKKVLVTGHTGFKGSWLSLCLLSRGARVTGYALSPPTTPSLFETGQLSRDIRSVDGDVRNFDSVLTCIRDEQPEIVFHLAAQSLVRKSYADPKETYATNVMGTVHILEAVRRVGSIHVVVNVTSDKCYDNQETGHAHSEIDPMGGKDPYSSSKGCAELITAAYQHSFFSSAQGTRLISARAGNVIGGGDWAEDRLIPDCIRAFTSGVPVTIRNPSSVRPWQHVLEPVSGYMLLAKKLWEGEKYSNRVQFRPSAAGASAGYFRC